MGKATAFVTGASRGIGRGIAIELAKHGYDIAGGATKANPATRESGLYEVMERVEELGQRFVPVTGDIADLSCHERMIDDVTNGLGAVDVLVNNAGVSTKDRLDILETTAESFDRLMDINVRGPFFLSQRVAHQMATQIKSGRDYTPAIVFVTSISSTAASPNRAEYCISKAALTMAAQNYAVRLADEGIRVFEVQPGIIETDMTAGVQEKYDRLIEEGLLLQKRWGTPEDIGKACAALAEGYFDYAQGAAIEVGGGFSVGRL